MLARYVCGRRGGSSGMDRHSRHWSLCSKAVRLCGKSPSLEQSRHRLRTDFRHRYVSAVSFGRITGLSTLNACKASPQVGTCRQPRGYLRNSAKARTGATLVNVFGFLCRVLEILVQQHANVWVPRTAVTIGANEDDAAWDRGRRLLATITRELFRIIPELPARSSRQ